MKKILLLLFLSGCATSYQPAGFTGGYADQPLGNDMFKVEFHGNGFTNASRVKRLFLKRCADLTIQNNHQYFVVLDQEDVTAVKTVNSGTSGNITPQYGGGYRFESSSNSTAIFKSSTDGIIRTFKEGSQPQHSFDARVILADKKND